MTSAGSVRTASSSVTLGRCVLPDPRHPLARREEPAHPRTLPLSGRNSEIIQYEPPRRQGGDAMSTSAFPSPITPPPVELHRITLDVYREMGQQGLILPAHRVELLDGLLVKKMTKGPRHVTVSHRIFTLLLGRLPAGWCPRMEAPIELPEGPEGDSAPEPDLAVVAGVPDDYNLRHPGPGEIALIIELPSSPAMRRARPPRARALRLGGHPHRLDRRSRERSGRNLHRADRPGHRPALRRLRSQGPRRRALDRTRGHDRLHRRRGSPAMIRSSSLSPSTTREDRLRR